MENTNILRYRDFDDVVNYYIDRYLDDAKTICLISSKENVEYTVIKLFSYEETSIDEMYLFESDLPLLVGIDKYAKVYADDTEDERYLDYDIVMIDSDLDYNFDGIIEECNDMEIEVILFGKLEKNEIKKEVSEDKNSIDIIIDGDNYNTEIHMYDSEGLDVDGILSLIDKIFG